MSRIAYLIGIPGSGKGEAVKRVRARLGDRIVYVCGDHLLHWLSVRVCPYLKPEHSWADDLWPQLASNCDLHSAFRRVIDDLIRCRILQDPRPSRPLLVEATLFVLRELREPFEAALRDLKVNIESTAVFWLAPSAAIVTERMRERIEKGDRSPHTLVDVSGNEVRFSCYERKAPHDCDRSTDTNDLVDTICQFLQS